MCGRYAVFLDATEFEATFGVAPPDGFETYNAAPSQRLPVVRASAGGREAVTPEWGFVPAWAGDEYSPNSNARAETIREKPSFEDAYASQRCLVPANGFYEWRTEDGENVPYYFERPDGEPFAMAGVWSEYVPETTQTGLDAFAADGPATEPERVETFAVVTREPTGIVADYHHRMSVVVPESEYDTWLTGDDPLDVVTATDPTFEARRVSTAVNDPGNDSPDLTRPV